MFPSLNSILEFLTDCFEAGKAYRTINVYRSMFSSTIDPIDSFPVGQHPLVRKLLKGIYLSNPPRAKYASTWNVDDVLRHIDSLGSNSELSVALLSKKLVVLLAVTTLLRVSEIGAIDFSSIVVSDTKVSFALGKVRKAQKNGSLLRITLNSFPSNVNLCPVRCLRHYVYLTDPARCHNNQKSLLIATRKPFKCVTGATVGRWIKGLLKDAGVDTDTFLAHSTRGASASRAVRIGVAIDSVLSTAQWANASTFAKYYNRDIGVDFGNTILAGVGPQSIYLSITVIFISRSLRILNLALKSQGLGANF